MRRKVLIWLACGVTLLALLVLAGCAAFAAVAPVKPAAHPGFAAGTACDSTGCHTPDSFKPAYTHKEPYLGPCETCHTLDRWTPAVYSHKDTTFDFGMHPLVGCAMCHTEGEKLPSRECSTCHEAPHAGPEACVGCHTTNAWGIRKPLPEGHVSLLGSHSTLKCFDCHEAAKTPVKDRTCSDCHGTNHGGLTGCQRCHDPETGWEPKDGWSHDSFFKITGQHKKLECTQCHKGGRFAGTPRVCVGCHGKQHGGLTDCAGCHTTAGFKPADFSHKSVFRLTGRHADLKCTECHAKRQFAKVLGNGHHACVDCHGVKHGGLRDCAECHTTAGFLNTTFRHTAFPLTGEHAHAPCSGCHPGGDIFLPHPSHTCANCHQGVSPHGAGTSGCDRCHTPAGFDTASFDHPSSFPLVGGHNGVTCAKCHPDLVFVPAPGTACANCHAGDSPHGSGTLNCQNCHNPANGWTPVGFEHPAAFPLTGKHLAADCSECHPGMVFSPPPNPECTSCH